MNARTSGVVQFDPPGWRAGTAGSPAFPALQGSRKALSCRGALAEVEVAEIRVPGRGESRQ